MDPKTLAERLTQLTGGLSAVGGTSADLDAAREVLARVLTTQPFEATHAPDRLASLALVRDAVARAGSGLQQALHAAAARAVERPDPAAPAGRVFLRTVPARVESDPAAVPDWARGMKVNKTFGPFQSVDGGKVWIDLYLLVVHVGVARQPSGTPFLLVEMPLGALKPGKSFSLAAGSVWISSPLITTGAPAGGWTGIAI